MSKQTTNGVPKEDKKNEVMRPQNTSSNAPTEDKKNEATGQQQQHTSSNTPKTTTRGVRPVNKRPAPRVQSSDITTVGMDDNALGGEGKVNTYPKKGQTLKPTIFGEVIVTIDEKQIIDLLNKELKRLPYIKRDSDGNVAIFNKVTTGNHIIDLIIANAGIHSRNVLELKSSKEAKEAKFTTILSKTGAHAPIVGSGNNARVDLASPTNILCIGIDPNALATNTDTILSGVSTIDSIDLRSVYNDLMDVTLEPATDAMEGFAFSENGINSDDNVLIALNLFKIIRDNMEFVYGLKTIKELTFKSNKEETKFAVVVMLSK